MHKGLSHPACGLEPTWMVRAAFRHGYAADVRGNFIGFRVADLTP